MPILKAFLFSFLHWHVKSIKTHSAESKCVKGLEIILLKGTSVYLSARDWGSEGVKIVALVKRSGRRSTHDKMNVHYYNYDHY